MRILYSAKDAGWLGTGYGMCCHYITTGIKHKHNLRVLAPVGINYGSITVDGIPYYSGFEGSDKYGENAIVPHYVDHKADIYLNQADIFALHHTHNLAQRNEIIWVPYPAIDYAFDDVVIDEVIEKLKHAYRIIPMTSWAEHELKRLLGKEHPKKTMPYIHHGINENVYFPYGESKQEIINKYPETRESLGAKNPDDFLITMNMANQWGRKNIVYQFQLVKDFIEANPDINVRLYLHMFAEIKDSWNIPQLLKYAGLFDITEIADPYELAARGFTEVQMAAVYNCSNLILYLTGGESFGLPIIESMACGTPVLCTDYTSMPELVKPFPEFRVKVGAYWLQPMPLRRKAQPDMEDALDRMNRVLDHESSYLKKISKYAHETFSWGKVIIPKWLNALSEIETAIDEDCLKPPIGNRKVAWRVLN